MSTVQDNCVRNYTSLMESVLSRRRLRVVTAMMDDDEESAVTARQWTRERGLTPGQLNGTQPFLDSPQHRQRRDQTNIGSQSRGRGPWGERSYAKVVSIFFCRNHVFLNKVKCSEI